MTDEQLAAFAVGVLAGQVPEDPWIMDDMGVTCVRVDGRIDFLRLVKEIRRVVLEDETVRVPITGEELDDRR